MNIRKSILRNCLSLVLVAQAASACSRDVPSEWSSTSPLSAASEPAAQAAVSVSLDGDPPLPGEANDAWAGLEQPAAADPHAHHQHQQPASESPTPAEPSSEPTTPKPKPQSKAKPAPNSEPEPEPAPKPTASEGHHHAH